MPMADAIDAPPAIRNRLKKLGLERLDDLVLHLPSRYEDETQITAIAGAPTGVPLLIEGRIVDVTVKAAPHRQLVARVGDASGDGSVLDLRFLSFYGSHAAPVCALRRVVPLSVHYYADVKPR